MRRVVPLAVVSLILAGSAHAATARPGNCAVGGSPAWSPDGRQIAWAGRRVLCIESAHGSGLHRIWIGGDGADELAWPRAHRTVVLANGELLSVDPAARRPQELASLDAFGFSIDRSGSRVAFGCTGDPHSSQPVVVDDLRTGEHVSIGGTRYDNCDPALSPSGRRVAFDRVAEAGGEWETPAGIWIASTDGTGLRRLVPAGSQPVWSPRGDRIVFSAGRHRLSLLSLASGVSSTLVSGFAPQTFIDSWSPNGKLFAFIGRKGRFELVAVATKKVRTLPWIGFVTRIAWSPDSKQILASASTYHPSCATIWRIRVATGTSSRVTPSCRKPG